MKHSPDFPSRSALSPICTTEWPRRILRREGTYTHYGANLHTDNASNANRQRLLIQEDFQFRHEILSVHPLLWTFTITRTKRRRDNSYSALPIHVLKLLVQGYCYFSCQRLHACNVWRQGLDGGFTGKTPLITLEKTTKNKNCKGTGRIKESFSQLLLFALHQPDTDRHNFLATWHQSLLSPVRSHVAPPPPPAQCACASDGSGGGGRVLQLRCASSERGGTISRSR